MVDILIANLRKVFPGPTHFNNLALVDPEVTSLDAAVLHQMTGSGELIAEEGLAHRAHFRSFRAVGVIQVRVVQQ